MGSTVELLHFMVMATVVMGLYPLFFSLLPRRSRWQESGSALPAVGRRLPFFDFSKGLAIMAVVLIHVTLLFPIEQVTIDQQTLDVFNNILRFAIAFFLIASGMLLTPVGKRWRDWHGFYARKVTRIVVPYLLVALALGWYQGLPWTQLGYQALTGEVSVPFYFMSILIQLYLLYPLVQPLATRWWFVLLSLLLAVVAAMVPALQLLYGVPLAIPYLFFFVWGIYMRPAILEGRVPPQWLYWLAIIVLYVAVQMVVGVERMYNLRFFFGPAAFLLLYWVYIRGWFEEWFVQQVAIVGQLSLWIFLLHFPILELLIITTTPEVPNWPWTILVAYSVGGLALSIAAAAAVSRAYAATAMVIVPKFGGKRSS